VPSFRALKTLTIEDTDNDVDKNKKGDETKRSSGSRKGSPVARH
jgi:hypothetical protein